MKRRIIVIGAGVGGLTTAAWLAQAGYQVTVLEAQTYPGGSAGTFYHQGYRFDAGATVAGGFQPDGPHDLTGKQLDIRWPVRRHDPAWIVHLPGISVEMRQDYSDILAKFPRSAPFWHEQQQISALAWKMAAHGLPFPPGSMAEFLQLAKVGLRNFPADLLLLPFAFSSVAGWLKRKGLANDSAFVRLLDASLMISAQATTQHANALYGATALDLARQGVYHVERGIGTLAETLVAKILELGSEVLFRQRVTNIEIEGGRVTGIYASTGRRTQKSTFYPADFVAANVTPWSLDALLSDESPRRLQHETRQRPPTWGAFVLHVGLRADKLPADLPDHHQIVTSMQGTMGEGETLFLSISPLWDMSRAPDGYRAVTVSTHTAVQPWWDALHAGESAYEERKNEYAERILAAIDRVVPGFKSAVSLMLPGTPVTYAFYTLREQGMVGGFPQTSLFAMRSPRTGIANLRLVGDSIFPGQSTAGVTLGGMRVAKDVQRSLPLAVPRFFPVKGGDA